jgi:energy-coupling factor transport system ATP-binding protein
MNDAIIKIEGLSYTYPAGNRRALEGLSFEIYKGEYVALLGANGAGKTTLSLHMNGVLPLMLGGKMGGTIHIMGREPYEHHVYEVAQHVGMVLQDPEAQLFSSDVMTEVAFAAENRGMPREEILEQIKWALGVVRLSDYAASPPNELSGGQKQRLVIASNLIVHPEILVLDEPTSQLDPVGTSEVFSTLRDLNKKFGMTILVATHATDKAAEYADRILVLEEGKLIAFDPPKKVFFQAERMQQALVNIPEAADLDHHMRGWAAARGNGFRAGGGEACVTVGEVKDALEEGLKAGKIRPEPAFTHGLGRHVPESVDGQSQETVLDVQNVSYGYSKKAAPAIQNISLSLRQGEVVAMVGQNGAGKTTLMKCITGVFKSTQGSVKINGVDVTRLNALERAKQVGLILQNPDNQLFRMSAEEEVAFGLTNQGLSKAEIKRITDEVLQLTGMEKFRHVYPFRLSLGDRRKLAVASIYAMHPSILIFDEPTTGQDFQGRYQLCDLAMRLNRMGTTIIMITHDMSLVAKYTQRTLVMGKGTILLDAPTREVFSHRDVLSSTFLEPPPVVRLAQELKEYGVPQEVLTVEELYNTLTGEMIEAQAV